MSAPRPDIVVLRSLMDSAEQVRSELKGIGDERGYLSSLRVLKTQGQLISELVAELLRRHDTSATQRATI